jgi:hypothetical protein
MKNILLFSTLKRSTFAAILALAAMLCAAAAVNAQTVISRNQIGSYSEDITFVSSGPLKDSIVVMDGYDVYAVKNTKKNKGEPMVKLFDLRPLGIDINPRGITYIESEGLFIVTNTDAQPTKLFLFDSQGQPRGTRTVQYLNGYTPGHLEGLTYIPASSPTFPDHLIMASWDDIVGGASRLEVIRRDGQVEAEIIPNWPPDHAEEPIGDVAFLSPNRLLVTFYDNTIWTIDFNGNVVSGPQLVADANGFEGIVQMSDSRVVAVGFPQRLLFFDSNLNRLPDLDRNDIIGLNLNIPLGVAWNSTTNQHLVAHDLSTAPTNGAGIAAVPTTLDSASPVVNLSAFPAAARMSYLPGEQLIAVAHRNDPRAILLFRNDGTLHSQIDLSPASLGQNLGGLIAVAYIPSTNQFAVRFNGVGVNPFPERRKIRIISRTGTLQRTIDLTCTGTQGIAALDYFNPAHSSGGQFIILGSAGRVLITDFNGNLIREFNSRVKLGLLSPIDIAAITTGPQADAFSVVDGSSGEIVIFRLD